METRVERPGYLRVVPHRFRHGLRSLILPLHTEGKGPKAPGEQGRDLRCHHLPQVLPPRGDRLDQLFRPHEGPARQVAVPPQVLGGAVHGNIGTKV